MALDRTRPFSEHDGSNIRELRYMQDGKYFFADGEEFPSANTEAEKKEPIVEKAAHKKVAAEKKEAVAVTEVSDSLA